MQQDFDLGRLPVKARLLVADILDGLAGHRFDLLVGDRGGPAGFTGDHHPVGGGQRFAGDAHLPWVHALFQRFAVKQVDHFVRYAVADLVRMTFGNRLAGEQIILACHA